MSLRGFLILLCIPVSAMAAYYGQPLAGGNSDAIVVLTTVMTIFAGFLVAIIAVLGDPGTLPKGSWRGAELRRPMLVRSVLRHASLFYVYLLAIALLFIGVLVSKEPCSVVPLLVKIWVERAYLFFGVFSFLLTLGLPKSLANIQIARTDAEIEKRRATGTPPDDDQ